MTQRSTFFGRRALLILVIVFFLVPFVLRGARVAVQNMKNDVKDWLPADYPETAELDWFREHFLGEQFVVASWDGCGSGGMDERLKLFLAKLRLEEPPEPDNAPGDAPDDAASDVADDAPADTSAPADDGPAILSPLEHLDREGFIGDHLGLCVVRDDYYDWGGQREKWLQGNDGAGTRWYYITPDGDLYRWNGTDVMMAAAWRQVMRALSIPPKLSGDLVHSFGPKAGAWYYERPRRLRAQLFKTVTTGPTILANLIGPHGVLADDPEEAKRRLTGTLFGPDGEQTCLIVTLTDAARRDLHQVLGRGMLGRPRGRLYEIAEEVNLKPEQLRLGGPPVDNVAIDEEGTITLVRLIGFSIVLGLTLSMICFRSVTATIMVFFVGGISAVLSLSLVYWGGSSVDAIMMSMPSMVYVLGLSGAAHILNYYHAAVAEHGYVGAPEQAILHGWKPAVLCNVTTALGMASLATSDLAPIRKFGIFSAIGILATLLILFTYLPASLQLFPQRLVVPRNRDDDNPWLDQQLGGFWNHVGGFCIRHNVLVSLISIVIIAGLGVGVVRIKTSVNMLKMFHPKAKIIEDYVWLESHLGRLVPMEVVLKVSPDALLPPARGLDSQAEPNPENQYQLSFLERLELADRVQRVVEYEFGPSGQNLLGRGMSAATFAPPIPAPRGDTTTFARRGATNRQLELHRPSFLASDYLRDDRVTGSELWRISLRVAATRGVDYGAFVTDLKAAIEPVLAAYEFRDSVLRSLVEQREGKRPSGAKILLLGMTSAAMADQLHADDAAADQQESTIAPEHGDREVLPVDSNKVFARTLRDLLQISRLRVNAHIVDVNPLPDNWRDVVATYDCVVLLDDAGYDVAAVQQAAKLLVDARGAQAAARAITLRPSGAASDDDARRFSAVYTGIVPIVYKAQRSLLDDLIESTVWSFASITPLVMLVARSFAGGMVAMLPNVLPVLVVFGAIGWIGINIDVGSMMTASVALGVAVDDTVHYLNWFREELNKHGDRHAAILAAYRHCATPTLQAAFISGLGLSVFALSTFTPTQRFGFLMLAILWVGVVSELLFFPALLAGPLGRAFKPRRPIERPQPDARHSHTHLRMDPAAPSAALVKRS